MHHTVYVVGGSVQHFGLRGYRFEQEWIGLDIQVQQVTSVSTCVYASADSFFCLWWSVHHTAFACAAPD